jgi:two-component system, NarL family, nitrate/nitrite response regulator NarL
MKIAIVDNLTLVLQALKSMISAIEPQAEVFCFTNPDKFVKSLSEMKFELVFIELHLHQTSSTELCAAIKKQWPQVKVYFLSGDTSALALREVLSAKADGIIGKNAEKEELYQVLKQTGKTEFFAGKNFSMAETDFAFLATLSLLNKCEQKILSLLAQHFTSNEIAVILNLTVKSVDAFHGHILRKLKLSNTNELILFALKNDLV